jgi:NDP-sugar pyrophosphorylase family protein
MLKNISKYKTPAFLPILNKSILSYQLEFLERNNIKYFKLITYEEHRQVFEEFFNQNIQRLKFEVIYLPSTEEETDIFSLIKDTITKNNFILISCDSILNFDLFEFIDNHFEKKSLVSFILNDNFSNISNKKLSFMKDNNQLSLYYVNNEDCNEENKRGKAGNGSQSIKMRGVSYNYR